METLQKLRSIRDRLNGGIFLILGNHDLSISANRWIDDVGIKAVLKCDSLDDFWLYHYPRESDEIYNCCKPLKRPLDDGKWAFTGHVHEKWRIKNKCLNVGVDVHDYKPVTLQRDVKKS